MYDPLKKMYAVWILNSVQGIVFESVSLKNVLKWKSAKCSFIFKSGITASLLALSKSFSIIFKDYTIYIENIFLKTEIFKNETRNMISYLKWFLWCDNCYLHFECILFWYLFTQHYSNSYVFNIVWDNI